MPSQVILNIFIGLILVYVIYSLFATILMEIIATTIGLRARNMNTAIARMLVDDIGEIKNKEIKKKAEKEKNKSSMKLFGRLFHKFLNSSVCCLFRNIGWQLHDYLVAEQKQSRSRVLYRSFFSQQVIKRLSSGKLFSKPSYMKAETFSKGLLDSLKELGGKGQPIEQIKNGIKALEKNNKTKELLNSFLADADNDLVKFKLLIEKWFDNTMERIIGWYRRKNQLIVLILGFCIATIFNVNTITIVKKLSKDEKARDLMVQMATSYVKENEELINTIREIDNENKSIAAVDTLATKLESLTKIQSVLKQDIDDANSIMGLDILHIPDSFFYAEDTVAVSYTIGKNTCKQDTTNKNQKETAQIKVLRPDPDYIPRIVKADTLLIFVYIPKQFESVFNEKFLKLKKNIESIRVNSCGYIYPRRRNIFLKYHWNLLRNNFPGILLTSLAISLGAPFWFDLLNKLVNLRSSLQEPIDKTSKSKRTDTSDEVSPLNRKG